MIIFIRLVIRLVTLKNLNIVLGLYSYRSFGRYNYSQVTVLSNTQNTEALWTAPVFLFHLSERGKPGEFRRDVGAIPTPPIEETSYRESTPPSVGQQPTIAIDNSQHLLL